MEKITLKLGIIIFLLFIWDLSFIVMNLEIIKVGFFEEIKSMPFLAFLNCCIMSMIYSELKKTKIKEVNLIREID